MLHALSQSFFNTLAKSPSLAAWASRTGLHGPGGFARRFIGGETIDEVIAVATDFERRGFRHTLNHLGEHVQTADAAARATADYLATIEAMAASRLECKISVKLSQVGLELGRETCVINLRQILSLASEHQGFVRIDMEGSRLVEDTLAVFDAVWAEGARNVGVVLQAYLHRTPDDLDRIVKLGARIRLCKGAYKEPSAVALSSKDDVDAAFLRLANALLSQGTSPAIATHDPHMIAATRAYARDYDREPEEFEFQMLYGVRRDLQDSLRAEGYQVRVYVPFGPEWFPYTMRRLAERPENVGFVVRNLITEGLRSRDASRR